MNEQSGHKRRYESPRRREQATETAARILAAADRLFRDHGYMDTTMAMIAKEAGVALKTVYLAHTTKSGVLRALWDTQLRGAEDIPVAGQPWYQEVLAEPDPRRRLRANAHNSTAVKSRIGGVLAVIRDAAGVDADIRALWDLIESDFYANQRTVIEDLYERGLLQPGLDLSAATDRLWTLMHPDLWRLLVVVRGWTPEQYEQWLADMTCQQLLPPAT